MSDQIKPLAGSDPEVVIKNPDSDGFLFNEIQLILAEKRTSLSTLRTGIAIFALPLSVLSVLVATSRYYDPAKVKVFLVVLGILNGALVLLGTYLIARALRKIRRYDSLIREIKLKHSAVAEFLD
jgi:uncharacterized membrane protein YidH (DUF202 family)